MKPFIRNSLTGDLKASRQSPPTFKRCARTVLSSSQRVASFLRAKRNARPTTVRCYYCIAGRRRSLYIRYARLICLDLPALSPVCSTVSSRVHPSSAQASCGPRYLHLSSSIIGMVGWPVGWLPQQKCH